MVISQSCQVNPWLLGVQSIMWIGLHQSRDECFSFHTESQVEPNNIAPLRTWRSQPLETVNGTRLWKINEVLQKTNTPVFLLPTTGLHPGTHRYKIVVDLQKKVFVLNLASFLLYLGQNIPPMPALDILPLLPRWEQGLLCTGTQHRVCTGELWAEGRRATVPCTQRTNILT